MPARGSPAALIRELAPADSLEELTGLLHRAYRALAARGLNYTAAGQDVGATARRVAGRECLVAERAGRLVATVVWSARDEGGCRWYDRPDVAKFQQFGVEPELQGAGVGSALLAEVERRARSRGAAELACDTAEPARELVAWYERRGFRVVERVRWEGKTYRSVVLSKRLGAIKGPAASGQMPGEEGGTGFG